MMRKYAIALLVVLALGCGRHEKKKQSPQPVPAPAPVQTQAPTKGKAAAAPSPAPASANTADAGQVTMSGNLTFKLFRTKLDSGESQKPTFEVSSPEGSLAEGNVWELKKATAIAYGQEDGQETRFEAGSVRFDNANSTADLKDGVVVTMDTRRLELQDATWSNDKRIAKSVHPVTLTDGETRLEAGGMEFHADTQAMTLTGVVGRVSLNRTPNP